MSVVAQYLFGSHARGDYNEQSDVDVLSITNESHFRTFSHGKLNVSFYPEEKILEDAQKGALFVLHIVREAVVIYDSYNFNLKLREQFELRNDYGREIRHASDLGWFLIKSAGWFRDSQLVNRRLSWCVRTILIAITAQEGRPVFSPHDLSAIANRAYVPRLLALKSIAGAGPREFKALKSFLMEFGFEEPPAVASGDLKRIWTHFRSTANGIAMSTVGQLDVESDDEFYS